MDTNNRKNTLKAFFVGVTTTIITFLLIGDVEVDTDFQFGEKNDKENHYITISIEKYIDVDNKDSLSIEAIGRGAVTMKDIEHELERVFIEKNIDASSGVNVKITLDSDNYFE